MKTRLLYCWFHESSMFFFLTGVFNVLLHTNINAHMHKIIPIFMIHEKDHATETERVLPIFSDKPI